MGPARIYPWRKMHRSRAPSIAPGTFFVAQPWADCITNMPGFNLRQAQDSFLPIPYRLRNAVSLRTSASRQERHLRSREKIVLRASRGECSHRIFTGTEIGRAHV